MSAAGKPSFSRPGAGRNTTRTRSIIVQPHIAFYRINRNIAEVVRVIDGRQDIDELFLPQLKDK
jgi:plasmid stabilization system protein ParE